MSPRSYLGYNDAAAEKQRRKPRGKSKMQYYLEMAQMEPEPTQESPAERVLRLAEQLPATRSQLEREAQKTENLLNGLPQAQSEMGAEITDYLAQTLEAHLDGILGLLDFDDSGDESILEQSLALLVESARMLEEVEAATEGAREEMPLVA